MQRLANPRSGLVVCLVPIVIALLACKKGNAGPTPSAATSATSATSASAPTAVAAPSASANWQPSKEAWCKFTLDMNRKHGSMVGNQYRKKPPTDVVKALLKDGLAHKEEYIAIAPLELREDVKGQIADYEKYVAWQDTRNWATQAPERLVSSTAGMQREARIFKYQVDNCGVSTQFAP